MIKLPNSGNHENLNIIGFTGKNILHFEVTDTNKFMYEWGYKKTIKRKLSKNLMFKYNNETYDASEVFGIKSAMRVK